METLSSNGFKPDQHIKLSISVIGAYPVKCFLVPEAHAEGTNICFIGIMDSVGDMCVYHFGSQFSLETPPVV